MYNEKVVTFQKQKISKLNADKRSLEQEIILLKKENSALRNINELRQYGAKELNIDLQNIKDEYHLGLNEIHELKAKYEEAISAANKARKEYADKMENLLQILQKKVK